MGRRLQLPGSPGYAAQYKDWMRTPEAQQTFKSDAERQANFANALNPYSQGYKPGVAATATGALPGLATDPYGAGNSTIREAMGAASMPGLAPGPIPGSPVTLPPNPPVTTAPVTTGMNNFAAADSLRKKRMRPGTGGPMAPPQLA